MTVAELIQALQGLPPDSPVWWSSADSWESVPVTDVEVGEIDLAHLNASTMARFRSGESCPVVWLESK